MTTDETLQLMDGLDALVEAVAGYRNKLIAAGFTVHAAEWMVVQWHQQMIALTARQ